MADGSDPATVYREKTIKHARRPHVCDECQRTIAVGESYQYVFGIWEGRPDSYRTCQHCLVAQDWLRNECNGWLFGAVREDLEEHVIGAGAVFDARRGYGSGPARLVVGMKRKWKAFARPGLLPVPSLPSISAHEDHP